VLRLRCYGWKQIENRWFHSNAVSLTQNFRQKETSPTNQTDRWTDRILIVRRRLHSMQHSSVVKMLFNVLNQQQSTWLQTTCTATAAVSHHQPFLMTCVDIWRPYQRSYAHAFLPLLMQSVHISIHTRLVCIWLT